MGICFGALSRQPDPAPESTTTPGTIKHKSKLSIFITYSFQIGVFPFDRSCTVFHFLVASSNDSKNIGSLASATSSSTGKSQFSEGAGVSVDEVYHDGEILETPNLKEFSFADLKTATRNFKTDSLLGEGGFGKVFKGWMDEKTLTPSKVGTGMVVAIKKLNSESMQGFQEWQVSISTP